MSFGGFLACSPNSGHLKNHYQRKQGCFSNRGLTFLLTISFPPSSNTIDYSKDSLREWHMLGNSL